MTSGWAKSRADATTALERFVAKYEKKYPAAVARLTKDQDALLAFHDLPAEHWVHLRTTNPIESVFATVQHRTVRTKDCLTHATAMAMVFKLILAAAQSWRTLKGSNQLPKLIRGVKSRDGIEVTKTDHNAAA